MAAPPVRGIGCEWTFLAEGMSTRPYFTETRLTKGVRIKEKISENTNIAIMEVMRLSISDYNKKKFSKISHGKIILFSPSNLLSFCPLLAP